jgi:prepilin-type N-terminal cleavage/methylation domain-containing protein
MRQHKLSSRRGFTIVELLIVIVVIGILAAIVIVAFNGIQTRSQNTQKATEAKNWQKIFEAYKAQAGSYPDVPTPGTYCLGEGFLRGSDGQPRCRDYQNSGATSFLESDNATLMSELRKVATIPKPSNLPASGTLGPYAEYSSTRITIILWLKGGAGDCPAGTIQGWVDSSNPRIACNIQLIR